MLRHKTWTENEGEKKQPVSKDELWKTLTNPGELFLNATLNSQKKVLLLGSKI